MATLQKFRILATQCAIAGSPTRSPTTSPVIHLRRRKTLRMLLSRSGSGGRRLSQREDSTDRRDIDAAEGGSVEKIKELGVRQKLKDLFVSSPPSMEEADDEKIREVGGGFAAVGGGISPRRGGQRGLRPLSAAFRQRLLRRAWRPVLVAIPE